MEEEFLTDILQVRILLDNYVFQDQIDGYRNIN